MFVSYSVCATKAAGIVLKNLSGWKMLRGVVDYGPIKKKKKTSKKISVCVHRFRAF